MRTLLQLVDLVTNDTLTLTASGILAVAVLALLVLIAWPSRVDGGRAVARSPRAVTARTLAASGIGTVEIARRTGLSRDALALMTGMTTPTARQKAPTAARLSLFQRMRAGSGGKAITSQAQA